jgi:hypothetical protein
MLAVGFSYLLGVHSINLAARRITSDTTICVLSMYSGVRVGWTKNIRLVSPNSRALVSRFAGRHLAGKASSR